MTLLYSALPHNVLLALYIIICAVQYNYTYFLKRSCPRFTALYNSDKKCSHIHTSSLTRWRQWPSLARWPCLAIIIYYLRVNVGDTESGHCQGACRSQWFFYVPLQVSETAPPFYVVMRATKRYTISSVEGREINLHMLIRAHRGLNPGPPRDRRTRYR